VDKPISAYSGDEPYIFVCYAHDDAAAVYPELAWLHSQGVNIWYDEGISPGVEWSEELGHAIEDASHILFMVTNGSAGSRHCRDEIRFALNRDKPVVALYLEPAALPVGLELAIGSTQGILAHEAPQERYRAKMLDVLAPTVGLQPPARTAPPASAPRSKRTSRWTAGVAAGLVVAGGLIALNFSAMMSWLTLNAPQLFFGEPMEQRIGFATTNDGVRIAYATTGAGPPVVQVLGWATHIEQGIASPLYDVGDLLGLSSRDHLFVRYDGRGFGLSDRDITEFSLETRLADLEAVVDALGLERLSIYALSAGGPTAIAYTAKHPERVSALVLASTEAASLRDPQARERFERRLDLFATDFESPAVSNMLVDMLNPEANDVSRRVISEFLRRSGRGPQVAAFLRSQLDIDVTELATTLHVPTLVIHGRDDAIISLEAGRVLASLIPGAKFEVVEGGHGPGTGSTAPVRQRIMEFLSEHAVAAQ
jgi:pimeloyl-ACP methyl ester carboxylesterase